MFKWKKKIEENIKQRIVKINTKTIILILVLMILSTIIDFYLYGFSLIKLILLEAMVIIILINIKLLA